MPLNEYMKAPERLMCMKRWADTQYERVRQEARAVSGVFCATSSVTRETVEVALAADSGDQDRPPSAAIRQLPCRPLVGMEHRTLFISPHARVRNTRSANE